jgi:hypothetical protein
VRFEVALFFCGFSWRKRQVNHFSSTVSDPMGVATTLFSQEIRRLHGRKSATSKLARRAKVLQIPARLYSPDVGPQSKGYAELLLFIRQGKRGACADASRPTVHCPLIGSSKE